MARKPKDQANIEAWMPNLFDPIFKRHSMTLKQVSSKFFARCPFLSSLYLTNMKHLIFNFFCISRTLRISIRI